MTPREYMALKRVWATERATLHNAHFRGPETLQFLADDFMDPRNRGEREAQARQDKIEVLRMNQRLQTMRSGTDEGVPGWARDVRSVPPWAKVN